MVRMLTLASPVLIESLRLLGLDRMQAQKLRLLAKPKTYIRLYSMRVMNVQSVLSVVCEAVLVSGCGVGDYSSVMR